MKYKHFSIEEREKVQEMWWQKWSVRAIAEALERSPSSVSRELTRNFPSEHKRYTPRLAHVRALTKRKSRGRTDRLKNEKIRRYVISRLKLRWSPEQIAGRIGEDLGCAISHEAIYQFIYAQVHRNGWGELKPGKEDLRPYLRRRRKRRLHHGSRRCQRIFKPKGRSINERPLVVSERSRIGDWESDTVESKDHRPGINTLVERKTGYVFITKLRDKTSLATVRAMGTRLQTLPSRLRRTITFDNGAENSDWQAVEKQIGAEAYYANAYHSWERGTNENTNGLIRDFHPKGTRFDILPDEEIAETEYLLNTRPRKRLGWLTPLEVMSVALQG